METNSRLTKSSLVVAPTTVPDLGYVPGEGTTFLIKYFEPFDFHGRVFVREFIGPNGEYVTTHGPFHTEQEAMIETVGLTSEQLIEGYCTD